MGSELETQAVSMTRNLDGAQATVYRTPAQGDYEGHETFYFCCDTCGACGRRWLSHDRALDEAVWHVLNSPQHQEDHHGQVQGQQAAE